VFHLSILSQADERIFVSGQIGLVPSSLTIPSPPSLATEIPLVSQHANRIVKALSTNAGGGWDAHAQMILYWVTEERHVSHAMAAAQRLDRHATPILFLAVKTLPKNALIEKQVLYHTGRAFSAPDACDCDSEEGDNTPVSSPPIYGTETFVEGATEVRYEASYLEHATASAAVICVRGRSNWTTVSRRLKVATHLESRLTRALSVRLFYNITTTDIPPIQSLFHSNTPAVTPVPCRCICTRDQSYWDYALCILSV